MVLPPVTPRPEQLPLNDSNWSWDRFEAFCLDLISQIAEVKNCHRYGKRGDFQRGIDIFADLRNGERWVFQCKRYKQFTEKLTQKAIQSATYTADCYILLLSCEATSKVRDEVDKHPNWDIWDIQDISLKVRELPRDVARRLVETHFSPEWRRAFLGLAGLVTFVSQEDFFHRLLNPNNLFNHTWSLIGRTDLLQGLHDFINSEQRVAILTGRGGIGKTKLLHTFANEFSSHHPRWALRFLAQDVQIAKESLDELPTGPCVVVVDDAHRCDSLSNLLAFVQQPSRQIKLVLSSRPQGIDYLHSRLVQVGFDSREITEFENLKELRSEEVEELALQVLGDTHSHFVERLAEITRDCSLVTVIGGRLLAEKQIDPKLLERDEEFRNSVLNRFQDVLVGQISDRIEPQFCRESLKLISATAPIQPDTEQFQQSTAEFLDVERSAVVDAIEMLEESGVLLRCGYTIRITPDVLADHILHEACLKRRRITGYAQKVFEKFSPVCSSQILRNLAELDWRIHYVTGEETNLLAAVWQNIREEFQNASHFNRSLVLDRLKNIAYYQPKQTLELVEFAIYNSATQSNNENLSTIYCYTHENVLSKLPEILKLISYTLDYLPYCLELLWSLRHLGKNVLQEIASYSIDKSLEVNQTLLNIARRWLKVANEPDDVCLLLDILDPLLAKSGYSDKFTRGTFTFRPFAVSLKNTQFLRASVIQILADCLKSNQLRVVLRAVKSLESALRKPVGYFGREITVEEEVRWVPEQMELLKITNDFIKETTHPLIHLNVINILRWHIQYSSSEEVKQKAKSIINLIPKSYELKLTGALKNSWNWDWLLDDEEISLANDLDKISIINYSAREQRAQKIVLATAKEFLRRQPDASQAPQVLNDILQLLIDNGVQPVPWFFLGQMSEIDSDYAAQLCEATIASPNSPLALFISSLLYGIKVKDVDLAISFVRCAVETENTNLCRSLAPTYWSLDLTRKLLNHPDLRVREFAISALVELKGSDPKAAIKVALAIELGDSRELASKLCEIFDANYGVSPDALTDEELRTLLRKLESVSSLDDDCISEFLIYVSKRMAYSLVELMLKRIELSTANSEVSYEPLPSGIYRDCLNYLSCSDEYKDILRRIRDLSLNSSSDENILISRHYRNLYEKASLTIVEESPARALLDFTSISIELLNEWINSTEPEKIKAASNLIDNFSSSFIFRYQEFIINLLERAYEAGDECYHWISSNLFRIALSKERKGIVGQPFPEDVELHEKASALAKQFPAGSPVHKFFDSLAKHAEAEIKHKLIRDEEFLA